VPDGDDAGVREEVVVEFTTRNVSDGNGRVIRSEGEVSLSVEVVKWTISLSQVI